MTYYNYHAVAQNLIKSHNCTYAQIAKNHNGIKPALVLYFDNHKPMPIRIHHWNEYFDLLSKHNIKITDE